MPPEKPASPEKPLKPGTLEYPSVEHGLWTPVPLPARPPGDLSLRLKEIDPEESARVKKANCLTFHSVGCSGCFENREPGERVASAMAAQAKNAALFGGAAEAGPASFFFHLGDLVYKKDNEKATEGAPVVDGRDQAALYADQFYGQYAAYKPAIFAVAGNHDSKYSKKTERSPIDHFRQNFCAAQRKVSADNTKEKQRPAMVQPYLYWRLQTPAAHIIGLHTNDVNGGLLDDPMATEEPQYEWLVATLTALASAPDGRAVILALHYPPYSGAANFGQRGDPTLAPIPVRNPACGMLQPLAVLLQHAFRQTGVYPDLVISAHAHLYQRVTYTYTGGRQIPFLVAGNGGHDEIEPIELGCDKELCKKPKAPFPVNLPRSVILPPGDRAEVVSFNDTEFGFLRITVDNNMSLIHGEFFAATAKDKAVCRDRWTLDRKTHQLLAKPA